MIISNSLNSTIQYDIIAYNKEATEPMLADNGRLYPDKV